MTALPMRFMTYCGPLASQAEATSNSEKIKPVAVAVIKLCLSEGIRQLVSQSVKILLSKKFLKFRGNFLKAFQVNLKTYLGLVLPNQYCPIVVWEN